MWETILVLAIVAAAGFYLGRRIVRTWRGKSDGHAGCAGCARGKDASVSRRTNRS